MRWSAVRLQSPSVSFSQESECAGNRRQPALLELRQNRELGIAAHPASALDCAQSRKQAQRLLPFCVPMRKKIGFSPLRIHLPHAGTRKARKDAMPHERGLLPVPPSEFSCPALDDPKARFCRSARHPFAIRQREPLLHPLTLGTKALILRAAPAARVLGPTLADKRLRATPILLTHRPAPAHS